MATRRVFRHVVVVVLFKTTKPEKKSAKKNIQTDDDEKDEKDETKNFFVVFLFYGIRKGCGFFDVIFGFWFFAYVRTRN